VLVVYPFRLLLELAEGRHTLTPYLGLTIRSIFAGSFRKHVLPLSTIINLPNTNESIAIIPYYSCNLGYTGGI
jgi:hypothetical protein